MFLMITSYIIRVSALREFQWPLWSDQRGQEWEEVGIITRHSKLITCCYSHKEKHLTLHGLEYVGHLV